MSSETPTPMMQQYQALRRELPAGTLLLFRLGDFYEMFGEDATEASRILNVALTRRGTTPMCGVPYHAARNYIEKLIGAGWRVAICDQVGEVTAGKLVRREISQVLSPGTLDDFGLDDRKPNFIAALNKCGDTHGLAYCDLSTGEFRLTELDSLPALLDELARVSPAEILIPDHQADAFRNVTPQAPVDGYVFELEPASELLRTHFKVHSLDGFGCADLPSGTGAAGALLHYITRQMRRPAGHLKQLQPYRHSEFLILDAATQGHLELVQSRAGRGMTLLGALDRTATPMGARLLRDWILHPLKDVVEIEKRQDAIAALLDDAMLLGDLRSRLADIRDIERATARLGGPSGNARDLSALAQSLDRIPPLAASLGGLQGFTIPSTLLSGLTTRLHALPELSEKLRKAIVAEPPAVIRDGGFIEPGYDPDLDELRSASHEGKNWIAALQEKEIERTGIKSLKVRFTSVFGYFIEITKANLGAVPSDYIRKQTTVNGERFITPELKEFEGKILGADERARAREIEIFAELRGAVLAEIHHLQETAATLAKLDAICSLAETARLHGYCRPEINDSHVLEICDGRHPVLDQQPEGSRFVPNDTNLGADGKKFAIITGPNMAGKSTYIRQVALLTLLAQTGSFVPAQSMRLGLTDRIFTRVGANDDLSRGQSTFMVEMNETANILNNATDCSLVILDEIGRGTSTFDGLSIAWSVAEYLHDKISCRALFATHYHELTDLERTRSGVLNLNVAVREWNDQIIFLRKILPGCADQSYGIQVARLAGLPDSIITRAKQILENLEKSELNAVGLPIATKNTRKRLTPDADAAQLALF
ncbi:MAG: DNA mismatch repair protein MutS [bacterium]